MDKKKKLLLIVSSAILIITVVILAINILIKIYEKEALPPAPTDLKKSLPAEGIPLKKQKEIEDSSQDIEREPYIGEGILLN